MIHRSIGIAVNKAKGSMQFAFLPFSLNHGHDCSSHYFYTFYIYIQPFPRLSE